MRACLLCAALGVTSVWAAEEDRLSFEERLMEDGEDPESSGDYLETRWRLREVRPVGSTYLSAPPELRHNLYFLSRVQMGRGPVHAGLLAKRAAVGPALSWQNLADRGVLKGSLSWGEKNERFRAVVGHFAESFGQGLLLYDGFGEFVRPFEVRDRGPRPDTSTGVNDNLRGAAARWTGGRWTLEALGSDKPLDFPLNPDGTVNANLDDLHETSGDVQTATALGNDDNVRERVMGARIRWGTPSTGVAVNGLAVSYSREFNPAAGNYADARAFRGKGVDVWSVDGRWENGTAAGFGEFARSRTSAGMAGAAWLAGVRAGSVSRRGWTVVFDYDPTYFSPHGKAVAFAVSGAPQNRPRNQRGAAMGGEGRVGAWEGRFQVTTVHFPAAVGNGSDGGPLFPSRGRFALVDQTWDAGGGKTVRLSFQDRREEKREDVGGFSRTVTENTQRARLALAWKVSARWSWGLRYDERRERIPALPERRRGSLWAVDAGFAPDRRTVVKGRVYLFDSPEAYLTTGPEEIWDGVVYDRLAGNLGQLRGTPGTRLYLIARRDWGGLRLWAKWEVTRRAADAEDRVDDGDLARHAWHLQVETRWGRNL